MRPDPRFNDQPFIAECRAAPSAHQPRRVLPVPRLANVEEFAVQLRRQLVVCQRTGQRSAVMMVAVDSWPSNAKRAELLAAVGARLRSHVRAADLVVQIGDDFGVFLQGDVAAHVLAIRERLRAALQDDYSLDDSLLRARPRFGLAIHPGTPTIGVDLVIAATSAMEV